VSSRACAPDEQPRGLLPTLRSTCPTHDIGPARDLQNYHSAWSKYSDCGRNGSARLGATVAIRARKENNPLAVTALMIATALCSSRRSGRITSVFPRCGRCRPCEGRFRRISGSRPRLAISCTLLRYPPIRPSSRSGSSSTAGGRTQIGLFLNINVAPLQASRVVVAMVSAVPRAASGGRNDRYTRAIPRRNGRRFRAAARARLGFGVHPVRAS
jgi:hypothetical protein